MLIDKGYYDYDYAEPSKNWRQWSNSATNDDELKDMLTHFGIKPKESSKPALTPDEMQKIAMEELKEKKQKDA